MFLTKYFSANCIIANSFFAKKLSAIGDPDISPLRNRYNFHREFEMGYDKIVARSFGGPEVLVLEHIDTLPEPGAGEVRVRVEAAGVGYTDTILRRGRYIAYQGGLPVTPGYDVVGVIDKLGDDVSEEIGLKVGNRVIDMPVFGSYSQYLVRSATDVIPVPAGVEPSAAVEVPLIWMTAWQMLTRIEPLPRGATILVVGASGAVGRALVALSRYLGLTVIGTASSGNLAQVETLGATAIDYRRPDLVDAIRTASGGSGVAAAFDAIGDESWETSWSVLANGGLLVGYGLQGFLESGSEDVASAIKSLTNLNQTWKEEGQNDGTWRHTTFYDIRERRAAHPHEYRADAEQVLQLIADGKVVPAPAENLPLSAAADAHRRIASGGLQRRLVLQP